MAPKPPAPPIAPSPPAVKVSDQVFVVRADHLQDFTRSYVAGRHESVPSIRDLNPSDPRSYGYTGTLPQSRNRVAGDKLFRLYREEGTFARVMDQIAEDSWAEGWTLSTEDEAWAQTVRDIDDRLDTRGNMELADKWHLVGGTSLLYLNLDSANSDRWREPKNVVDVFHLKPIPRTRIKEARIETNPSDPRFDMPNAWTLTNPGDGKEYVAHWARVLDFCQYPNPDSEWDGLALGSRIFDDVAYKRNVEWAAATAYGQRNSPLLVLKIRDGVKVSQDEIDKMEEETGLLQNHTIQSVIARNFDVVPITGAAQLPDPMNFWLIAIRSLSVTTHIPSHILAGMASGELASSSEDTRRWHSHVSRRQENFCNRILMTWYGRLIEWGLIQPFPKDFKIVWKGLGEPTAKEEMEIENLRAGTIDKYRRMQVQPPAKVVDYEGQDPIVSELDPLASNNPFAQAPVATVAPVQEAKTESMGPLTDEQKLRVAGVRRVEQSVEDSLVNAFHTFWQEWLPTIMGFFAQVGQEAAPKNPPASVTLKLGKRLERAVMDAYEVAARLGAQNVFKAHGGDPKEIKTVLDRTGTSYFKTVSKLEGASTARRVTGRIRDEIAQGLASKEDVSLIRDRVQRTFNDLARFEAERIARTETMNAYNQGTTSAMAAAGIQKFVWRAYPQADDGDPNGPCNVRDGQVFEVGDEDNTPPIHPSDRCFMEPYLDGVTRL